MDYFNKKSEKMNSMRRIFHFFKTQILKLLVISLLVIFSHVYFEKTNIQKYVENKIVNPFYLFVHHSHELLQNISQIFINHSKLISENCELRKKLFLLKSELLLLEKYKSENEQLNTLLKISYKFYEKKIFSEAIYTNNSIYNNRILIDKGKENGIYIGQPVIDDKGVVGQVIYVGNKISHILLICDFSHALPVQILRNNVHFILNGNGSKGLKTENLPIDIDIKVGDILVSSGLDEQYPIGYPVAMVSSINTDVRKTYITVNANPCTSLYRLHYLLLLCKKNNSIIFY